SVSVDSGLCCNFGDFPATIDISHSSCRSIRSEEKHSSTSLREPERGKSKRLLCRRHPGRDSEPLIKDLRSERDLADLDSTLQKHAGKSSRDRKATGGRTYRGRKRAKERRRSARECSAY